MTDASLIPPGEALKFRIFIVFCFLVTIPLFPFSIAVLPLLIGLYVAFFARINSVKNQKITTFYLLPIAVGLVLPVIATAIVKQVSSDESVFFSVYKNILHFSVFESSALEQISDLSMSAQDWFSSVVLFGLFAIPLAHFVHPPLLFILKGFKYEPRPVRESDDRISRFVKQRPSVALILAILLMQVGALYNHIGLVALYKESSEIFDGFKAQTFIENLGIDQSTYPFMYLLGNGVLFVFVIFLVNSAAYVWRK